LEPALGQFVDIDTIGGSSMRAQARQESQDSGLSVEVVERKDAPGVWAVEAIDDMGDGVIYQSLFVGPDARERAFEYARVKYAAQ